MTPCTGQIVYCKKYGTRFRVEAILVDGIKMVINNLALPDYEENKYDIIYVEGFFDEFSTNEKAAEIDKLEKAIKKLAKEVEESEHEIGNLKNKLWEITGFDPYED